MPPSTWMHWCAHPTAASSATTAAAPAANSRWRPASPGPVSCPAVSGSVRAASQTAAAACSAAVSIHAHRCLTAWNWPIGRPNWWRILA